MHGIRLCSQVACSLVSQTLQLLISSIACKDFWLCTACGYTSCGAAWTSPSFVLLGLDRREVISRRFVVRLQELSSTTIVGCRLLRTLWRKLLQLSRHHYNPLKPACKGCSSSGSSFAYFSCRRFACWLRAASRMQRPRGPDGRRDLEPQPSPSVSTEASSAHMLPFPTPLPAPPVP